MLDEKLFRETFDQVQASPRLLQEVLDMKKTTKKASVLPKGAARVVLTAALICLLTTSVAAAAVTATAALFRGDVSSLMEAVFGNGGDYSSSDGVKEYDEDGKLMTLVPAWERVPVDQEVAQRLVAPYLYTLEENVLTKDGFTFTIEAIVYDSNTESSVMRWSVENPEGLGDYLVNEQGELCMMESSKLFWISGGRDYLDTDLSTDTKLVVTTYDIHWEDEFWVEFGVSRGERKPDTETIILPRKDFGGMEALHFDGGVTVSPIAIRFAERDSVELSQCSLRFADGSVYEVFDDQAFVDNTTSGLNDSEEHCVTYTFNRVVDVEQVTELLVNGMAYSVS